MIPNKYQPKAQNCPSSFVGNDLRVVSLDVEDHHGFGTAHSPFLTIEFLS